MLAQNFLMNTFKKPQLSINFHKLILCSHKEQLCFPALSAMMTILRPFYSSHELIAGFVRIDLANPQMKFNLSVFRPIRNNNKNVLLSDWLKIIAVAENCKGVENFQLFCKSQRIEKHCIIPTEIYNAHAQGTICSFLRPICANGKIALKLQSCKLCNNKYMIALTQITNTEIFTFHAVLVFKLLSCKVLFINRKDNRNC